MRLTLRADEGGLDGVVDHAYGRAGSSVGLPCRGDAEGAPQSGGVIVVYARRCWNRRWRTPITGGLPSSSRLSQIRPALELVILVV